MEQTESDRPYIIYALYLCICYYGHIENNKENYNKATMFIIAFIYLNLTRAINSYLFINLISSSIFQLAKYLYFLRNIYSDNYYIRIRPVVYNILSGKNCSRKENYSRITNDYVKANVDKKKQTQFLTFTSIHNFSIYLNFSSVIIYTHIQIPIYQVTNFITHEESFNKIFYKMNQ